MPEIEIRPAVVTDLAVLASLEHSYQTNYVWQMDRVIEKGQINITFREIRLPRAVHVDSAISPEVFSPDVTQKSGLLVTLMNGSPVGFISIKEINSSSTAWVLDLVVREQVRRQGIATALILAAEEWAASKKMRRIVLEMQSKNIPAIQLAFKCGFEFCGYNDQYYGNRDVALFFAKYLR